MGEFFCQICMCVSTLLFLSIKFTMIGLIYCVNSIIRTIDQSRWNNSHCTMGTNFIHRFIYICQFFIQCVRYFSCMIIFCFLIYLLILVRKTWYSDMMRYLILRILSMYYRFTANLKISTNILLNWKWYL